MDLVAVATEDELQSFVEPLEQTDDVLGRPLYGSDPVAAVTGVGRSNAAATVSVAIDRYDVDRVVAAGVAGALPDSDLDVGDTVVGSHVTHADLGVVTPEGFGGTEHLGFETTEGFHNEYPLQPVSLDASVEAVATVASVSAEDSTAREVVERTGAAVETMETAAVAQVATQADLPVSAVLGVSNHAGDDREFDFKAGATAVESALEALYR